MPDEYPMKGRRPRYEPGQVIAEAASTAPHVRQHAKGYWTRERCVRTFMYLMGEHPQARLTLRTSDALTCGDHRYPGHGAIARNGGLVALRTEAERRRRRR